MTARRTIGTITGTLATLAIAAGAVLLARPRESSAREGLRIERGNVAGEWRYWGGDAWSSRYSPLDQVNATNFNQLQVAWEWKAGQYGPDEYYRTTPLYANGRLLTVATSKRGVFAVDPATGQTLWQYLLEEGIRWQKAPRRFAGRGLAYWTDGVEERAVVATPGYHMVSLDAKTGKPDPKFGKGGVVDLEEGLGYPLVPLAVDDTGELIISEAAPLRRARPGETWNAKTRTGADGSVGIDPKHGQIANSSPPIIVGDVIVVGNSAMHGYWPLKMANIGGTVRGFDIRTGKQLWKFNLIPQPGEFGAETWKNGSKPGTPGTGKNDAWATYSADPELGLVYIPVGMPLSDEYGGHRPGDNLFGNSLVAIDAKTGQRKWHYQMVHHDIWDYDTPMAPNVMDVTIGGAKRKVIAQSTKQGWLYVLDRVTGQPIWPIPETPVLQSDVPGEEASKTQPIPSRPAPYSQQGLLEGDLIDYTPAIKDSALKIAKSCRMGPYYIPPALEEHREGHLPCSWYAPGASGGVNIDGGAAWDPETQMLFVGAQTGLATIEVAKDPCSAHRYSQVHDSCGLPGALPAPKGYAKKELRQAFAPAVPTSIGGIPILKPRELGGITAYDMTTGDKKWWAPNGHLWRQQASTDPLFKDVKLPMAPTLNGQAEIIVTKSLLIHGVGRTGTGRVVKSATSPGPQLYATDKVTGKQVGAVSIPRVNTAVPMTFMHQGKQYIVFATGQGDNTSLVALRLP